MTCRAWTIALGLLLSLCGAASARAQEVNLGAIDAREHHVLEAVVGAEHGFVLGVGYGHILRVADRPLILEASFTMPWASPDPLDHRLRVGAVMQVIGNSVWKLAARAGLSEINADTEMATLTTIDTDVGLRGGLFDRTWLAAAELTLDWSVTTHIAHSDQYRELIYADAVDGWYGLPGGNFNYGLILGVSFLRYDIVLRAGQGRNFQGDVHQLPLYALIGFNARF